MLKPARKIILKASLLLLSQVFFLSTFAQICSVIQAEIESNFNTSDRFAQSLTTCNSGMVKRIDLPVHKFNPGSFTATMVVYEGDGYTGDTLCTQNISLHDEWGLFTPYLLDEPFEVEANSKYTIEVNFNGTYGSWWAEFTDVYDGGSMYWNPTNVTAYDFGFKFFIYQPSYDNYWLGTESHEWHNPANWSLQMIPNEITNAYIPTITSQYYPIIYKDAITCNLIIEESAYLDLEKDTRLSMLNSIVNMGDAQFKGIVDMLNTDGTAEISGGNTFTHLIVHNDLISFEMIKVEDILDLSDGSLTSWNQNVTIAASPEHKGHVYFPQNNLTGSINFEKTILNQAGFQMLASPSTNSSLDDFNDDINVDSLISANGSIPGISFFDTDAISDDWTSAWVTANSTADPLGAGDLVAVLLEGGEVIDITGETEISTLNQNLIISNSGPQDLIGWHLIGNPFPSLLDWRKLDIPQHMDAAIYTWDSKSQQFSSYVNTENTHGGNGIINSMDGFFIHISENGPLALEYDNMVMSPDEVLALQEEESILQFVTPEEKGIRLKADNGIWMDETLILPSEEGEFGFQPGMDAYKLRSLMIEAPHFGSVGINDEVLSINSIPYEDEMTIPLKFEVSSASVYTFMLTGIATNFMDKNIVMEDTQENVFHSLSYEGPYSTQVSAEDFPFRFILHIGNSVASSVSELNEPSINIYQQDGIIHISSAEHSQLEVSLNDVSGKTIIQSSHKGGELVRIETNVESGIYFVNVSSPEGRKTKKIFVP